MLLVGTFLLPIERREHRLSIMKYGLATTEERFSPNGGFTLLELLITLVVAAVLLGAALPSFRTFVQNARLKGAADTFIAQIQRARSEAITRGNPVILCRTADSASDNCGTSANKDWSDGWLIYVKQGYGGSGGTDYASSDGPPLIRGGPAPQGVTITADADGDRWLTFFADGTLNKTGESQYAVCDDRGVQSGRLIVISLVGRPYVTDTNTCTP